MRSGQAIINHNLGLSRLRACFTEDGSSVITCGKGHFKSWSISHNRLAATLTEKPVSLAKDFRSSVFVAVKSAISSFSSTAPPASGGVYALTSDGKLLLMRATGRSLSHHVNLQVSQAFDLDVSENLVAVACEAGLVRVFTSKTLQYQTSLPRPPPIDEDTYPDAVGVAFSPSDGNKLAAAYSDRTITVFDVSNSKKASRIRTLSSHSGGIFSLKSHRDLMATASADGSIRLWRGSHQSYTLRDVAIPQFSSRPATIKAQVAKGAIGQVNWKRGGVKEAVKKEQPRMQESNAVCCLDISSDGLLLVAGDERGRIQVFDLASKKLLISRDQVHDGRIQAISISPNKASPMI